MTIRENVRKILEELPPGVELVAAGKAKTPDEIREAVEAGVRIIGENYVQEAVEAFKVIGHGAQWHFIGHLQKNKVRVAIEIFDLVETLDSVELAEEMDKRCASAGKILPVLVEINSGREPQKFGVLPEEAETLIRELANFRNIKVNGLMTMGPFEGDPEDARPYFKETKKVFDEIRARNLPGVEMNYLSMGMTNSYRVAIEEGANLVRLGTKIFGPR